MHPAGWKYIRYNLAPRPLHRTYGDVLPSAASEEYRQSQVYHPPSLIHTSPSGSFVSSYSRELPRNAYRNRGKYQPNLHSQKQSLAARLILARQPEVTTNEPRELENCSYNYEDFITPLEELAKEKMLPAPVFKLLVHKSRPRCSNECFSCVKVGEEYSFSSYPDGTLTELEAKQKAAELALKYLKELYSCIGTTGISVRNMMYNIVKIVSNYQTGTWHNNIAIQYHKTYGDVLPVNWLTIVRGCPYLVFLDVSLGKTIVTINKDLPLPDNVNDMLTTYHVGSESVIEKTVLHEGYHDVIVTAVISSKELYVRLLGEEYEKFCTVAEEINNYYKKAKPLPVSEYRKGCFYMIYLDNFYHRVMLLNLSGNDGELNFIDHGATEIHPLKYLFVLHPKFAQLPAQSVKCSMIGVEHLSDDTVVTFQVESMLVDKSVIVFVNKWVSEENHARAIFYDTSTSEDINVNLKVAEMACSEAKTPHLAINHMYYVYVAHVSNHSRWLGIYLRFNDKYMNCMTDILHSLMKGFPDFIKPITHLEIEEFNKIYLAYSEKNSAWYRAIILAQNPASQVLFVRFIDIGVTEQVQLSKVCLMKNISTEFARLPRQVIRVELENIVLTPNLATRLQDVLPVGQKVCIIPKDIKEVGAVPLVKMWKMCGGNKVVEVNYGCIKSGDTCNNLGGQLPTDLHKCCPHTTIDEVIEEFPAGGEVYRGAMGRLQKIHKSFIKNIA